jgi:uncharacterized protein
MKFIADVMLGRLAKRMRLLGFDVDYERTLDDNEIIHRALEHNRLILTRDTALTMRPLASNHVFIRSDEVGKQIQQVLESFPLDESPLPLTRCSECNKLLSPIPRIRVKDIVPAYVYDRHPDFLNCLKCGRIYWKGTHTKRMALPLKSK